MSTNAPPIAFYKSSTQLTDAEFQHQCQLRPYDPPGCPDPFTPHHCVPDHCFVETPGKDKTKTKPKVDEKRISISPHGTEMTHRAGLCICLDGPSNTWGCDILDKDRNNLSNSTVNTAKLGTHINHLTGLLPDPKVQKRINTLEDIRSQVLAKGSHVKVKDLNITAKSLVSSDNSFTNLGQHPQAHHIFDAAEKRLATDNENATPSLGQNVATLDQLENLAADVLSKITGCPRKALKRQMEYYHEQKGIPRHTLLRANTGGDLAKPANGHMLGNGVNPAPSYRMSRYLSREYRNRGI